MLVQQRTKVTIVCIDAKERLTFTRVWLPTTIGLSAAQSAAASLIARIRPLSDAKIASFSVAYTKSEGDTINPRTKLLASPLALFSFTLTDLPDTYEQLRTPLDPSWVLADGPLAGVGIDLTNSEVIELTSAIRDGPWCDPFGVDLSEVYSAFVTDVE